MFTTERIKDTLHKSFPFEKTRAEQDAAFEAIAPYLQRVFIQGFKPLFFGCDAPTGTGKSLIAVTTALAVLELMDEYEYFQKFKRSPQIWIITQNKLLQDQYGRDFSDELFDLRGLDNYKCFFDPGKTCGQSKCARLRAPEGAQFRPPEYCSKKCEYDQRKWEAASAPILLLNAAKAFTMLKNPKQKPPTLMIYDEGHGVEGALDNDAAFQMEPAEFQKFGFVFEKYFQNLDSMEEICAGLRTFQEDVAADYAKEINEDPDSRDAKKIRKCESILNKIADVLESGIEYITCSDEKLDLRPLKIHRIFRDTFAYPTLYLSATLLSKNGFESMTGLHPEELSWFSINSPFPKENREMYYHWRIGARPIKYENQKEEIPNIVERVRHILNLHPNDKGIIHTHTYNIANAIQEMLYQDFGRRLLYPKTAREQKDILAQHERSPNTVLLSPSMTEGVDLKDDLSRFNILCKVPYPPMGDPVVAARMESDQEWYNYKTAMTIVQAPGRSVRSMTDHAKTYFVDPGFQGFINRARHHFPAWFLESLQKGYRGQV
jgi:ATP-dependent DNA helicase DinG